MPEVTPLPSELTRSVSALARRWVMAARTWTVYPLARLGAEIEQSMPVHMREADCRQRAGQAVDPGVVHIDRPAYR